MPQNHLPAALDWTDSLSLTQARAAARIERQLRHEANRWARLEARQAQMAEDMLDIAAQFAAPFCVGECA